MTGVTEKIKSINPNVATRFLNMDLSDLAAVRRAVDDIADIPTIDHLVCVAGVMTPPYGKTKDGIEQQLAVNYLANFLLIKLLLPKVQAAGPSSSVVVMASSAVRVGKMNFDDYNFSVSVALSFLPFYSPCLILVSNPFVCLYRMARPMTLWRHTANQTQQE